MKQWLSIAAISFAIMFASCVKDEYKRSYTYYRPVYKTKQQVRNEVQSSLPRTIGTAGKLFYKDGYVFLNELEKGVHIIDIKNPSQPKVVSFVAIPGCVDLAVRGNILYADLTTDLIAIDISNPLQVKVTQVLEGVFPHRYYNEFRADTSRVIIDWVRVDTSVWNTEHVSWGLEEKQFFAMTSDSYSSASGTVTNGVGGSMARFALSDDRLYTVSSSDLKLFNTSVPEKPSYIKQVNIGSWSIETIFPYGSNLFIGSQTGMFIYDISNKDNPTYLSKFEHARVCDPVVADSKYAYITLRSGSACGGFTNQVDIVNIEKLTSPYLVKSYSLTHPLGLAVDRNYLLICDDTEGLRIMDASDPSAVKQIGQLKGFTSYDVIALGGLGLVSAQNGLYLVDYSNPANPALLSTVAYSK